MSTPTPRPSVSPTKASKDTFQVSGLPSVTSGTGTSVSVADLASASFNAQGLGLKFPPSVDPTKVGGQQLYDAIVKAATTKEGQSAWLPLKYALAQSHFYSSTANMTPGWGSSDSSAITGFLSALVHRNSDGSNTPVANYLVDQQNLAQQYGGAATQVQKVNVPSVTDLSAVADTAFRSALGRPPTAAEAKKFSVSYQQQVMANARASMAQSSIPAPATATPAPVNYNQPPTTQSPTTLNQAGASLASNFGKGPKSSTVLQQVQDVATPQNAAEEYARKAAPAEAGSQNISNALNAMFASLARNSQ